MGNFVHNYGLELTRYYPNQDRLGRCPYSPDAQFEEMSYLSVELPIVSKITLPYIEEYLRKWPMVININHSGDFFWYGGGVYDGAKCSVEGTHTVMLVGHGREDDEEYWLIRNSYSDSWGERGYIKLNKNSDCIHPRFGYVFADVRLGKPYLFAQHNQHVPEPVEKVHVPKEPERQRPPPPKGLGLLLVGPPDEGKRVYAPTLPRSSSCRARASSPLPLVCLARKSEIQ